MRMARLLYELNAWGVNPKLYISSGNVITTTNPNIVDVATETFIYHPELIKIEIVKGTQQGIARIGCSHKGA